MHHRRALAITITTGTHTPDAHSRTHRHPTTVVKRRCKRYCAFPDSTTMTLVRWSEALHPASGCVVIQARGTGVYGCRRVSPVAVGDLSQLFDELGQHVRLGIIYGYQRCCSPVSTSDVDNLAYFKAARLTRCCCCWSRRAARRAWPARPPWDHILIPAVLLTRFYFRCTY
jgi:hypothetical protein